MGMFITLLLDKGPLQSQDNLVRRSALGRWRISRSLRVLFVLHLEQETLHQTLAHCSPQALGLVFIQFINKKFIGINVKVGGKNILRS